jgi:hypothetical protein
MLTVAATSHEYDCRPEGRGYIVPEASNLTVDARSGGILIAENQVVSFKQQSQQSQQPLTRLRVAT